MKKNVAGQSVTVAAIDVTTGLLKTGDAANITLYYNGDNGGVTIFSTGSGHPSEDDATNSKGTYTIAATQGETNFDRVRISGKSSTSNIQIVPYEIITTPSGFGALTSAAIASAVWTDHMLGTGTGAGGDFDVSGTIGYTLANYVNAPISDCSTLNATQVASAVWKDTATGDFTVANSIGKGLFTNGVVPGGAGGLFIAGTNADVTANVIGNVTGNLSGSVGSVTAGVTVTTNNDKTGYTLTVTPPTAAQVATAVWTDHMVGTGTGSGGDFDVSGTVGHDLANFLGIAPTTTGISAAVWDLKTTGHTSSGTFGAAMVAAGSAGDPWSTAVPGAYGAGTAGFILGTNLDTKVSLVSAPTAAQVATAVWQDHMLGTGTGSGGDFDVAGTIGYTLANYVNAPISDCALQSQLPTRMSSLFIDPNGAIYLGTNQAFNNTGTWTGNVVGTLSTLTTYTNNTPQTGDTFALANGASGFAVIAAKTNLLPEGPAKNTAFTYGVKMVLASDHVTPATGLTVVMTRSLDGAAFAAATGTVTEISTGHYKVAASAADMNGDTVMHRFTAGTADDLTVEWVTTS